MCFPEELKIPQLLENLDSFGTYIDISKTLTKTTVPEIALAKDLGAFKFDIGYILDREVQSQWS